MNNPMNAVRPLPRAVATIAFSLLVLSAGCSRQAKPPALPTTVLPIARVPVDPQAKAAIAFLSESMADAESAIRYGEVAFSSSIDVTVSGDAGPTKSKYSSDVRLVFDGAFVRNDSKTTLTDVDKVLLSSSVCDGKEGRTWDRMQAGGKPPVSVSVVVSTPKAPYRESDRFYQLALLSFGGEPLSAEVMRNGISAVRSGAAWEVKLSQQNGVGGYKVVRIRPDRSYRAESFAIYSKDGTRTLEAKVENWVKVLDRVWLPVRVVHRFQGRVTGETTFALGKCDLKARPSHDLFVLKDDGTTPIFDDRTHRAIRLPQPAVVPTTGTRLLSTARFLDSLAVKETTGAKLEVSTLHDNGARNEPGRCGLECVWLIAEMQGKHSEWESLKSTYPSKDGTHSLLELRDAAAHFGLKLAGMKVPQSQLRSISTPFILYLEEGHHFCLVVKLDSQFATIYNPPGRTERVPIARLARVWDPGYVLATQPGT